jgi:hypothetical protein
MTWLLPMFMRVEVAWVPAVWLPLFLLWPLVFSVFVLGFVLALVVPGPTARMFEALRTAWRVLSALRGARLEGSAANARYSFTVH